MENLQSDHLDTQNLYRDMQKRTGGEIYIGVVGPVRTGKSTFIKRFMDVAVLPYMEDAAQKTRAQDELPQSAGGRTITTTEPKFIPQEAVELKLAGEVTIRVRLVDCVGFMVEGAAGHLEDGAERIEKQHSVAAMPVNCAQLSEEDIRQIMEQILYEFPVSRVEFYMPKWVEMLPLSHPLKTGLIEKIRELTGKIRTIRDVAEHPIVLSSEYVRRCMTERIDLADGCVRVLLDIEERYYYEMLSEYAGEKIENAQELLHTLRVLSSRKQEYDRVASAMEAVHTKGYGVVLPCREEIHLEQPEVIRHGNKFGVKIRAESPSLHFIRATVVTEIAPIVGTEQQAKDLIGYIDETGKQDGIWETNIFGKTVEQLVNDGIRTKISMIGEESQEKLQDTMQKIVNDSTGGMVCIII